jgi:hypothetical protein
LNSNSAIPGNRFYHFTKAKYAFDNLRNRRLKIAQLDDLNDPFELRSVNLCNPLHALAFEGRDSFPGLRATVALRFGVLCFSEDKADVLLWAHYADRHKGICLGFDVPESEGKFEPVEYVAERFPFPEPEQLERQLLDQNPVFTRTLLFTKSEAWKYEKEWRVFLPLEDRVWNECAGRDLYFKDFGSDLILREVILGAANENAASDVDNAIQGYPEPVRVARMNLSCSRFELQDCSAK